MKYNLYVDSVSVEAVFNKLGGVPGALRFLADELTLVEKSTLQSVKTKSCDFPIWRILVLGKYKTPLAYRSALVSSGFRVSGLAGDILMRISVAQVPIEVDLVRVTVAELGFKDGARRDVIYARALELGLRLCPAEVAPALRFEYQEQAFMLVGMDPITASDEILEIGSRIDTGGRWLHIGRYTPGSGLWTSDRTWVFVRPRKS